MNQKVEIEYSLYLSEKIDGQRLVEEIQSAVEKILESKSGISILHIETKALLDTKEVITR